MKKIDYLFIGAGASTTLLLLNLKKKGLLFDKNIIIIDPDFKDKNDKTFCFWSTCDDLIYHDCKHLISYSWDAMFVNNYEPTLLNPLKYHHIPSINVYNELRSIIDEFSIQREHDSVVNIVKNDSNIDVFTANRHFTSEFVFDSRPAQFKPCKENECSLYQSFYGYTIKTNEIIKNNHAVCLMDFNIDQLNATQFAYVLPFNEHTALVEITRFGSALLTKEDAEPLLQQYIQEHFGSYEITATESGVIPMSNAEIENNKIENVIPLGSRAGAIKPSTGYAFKRMFTHSENITQSLRNSNVSSNFKQSSRYRFYDRLLLLILTKKAYLGKPIFEQLFKNNTLTDTLEFIDESSNWKKELKILSSLPYLPFIKELLFDCKINMKAYAKAFMLLLTTLLCLFLHTNTDYYATIESILITAGLVLVGIPHGALDNIVEAKNYHKKIDFLFIVKYIGIALAVVIVWMVHAKLALLFFLAYSAWHFAETDFIDWKLTNNNFLKKMAWGVTLLGIILLGHAKETANVLTEMGIIITFNIKHLIIYYLHYFLIAYSILWSVIERKIKMFATTMVLILSTGLPLLSSFALYFIGQHSTAGWEHLKSAFKVNNIQLFKKTLPYNLAAWILLFVFFKYYNKEFISTFFVFISSISLPHILIMNKFYHTN